MYILDPPEDISYVLKTSIDVGGSFFEIIGDVAGDICSGLRHTSIKASQCSLEIEKCFCKAGSRK